MKSSMEVLLCSWAKWASAGHLKALGYPSTSPMFRDARPSRCYESSPPAGLFCGADQMEEMDRAINALPGLLRLIIIESYLFGGSQRDIAARIGISAVSVGRYLASAYEQLENILNGYLTAA